MSVNGVIPTQKLDDLNRTFNGFGLAEQRYEQPQKIINDTQKVKELKEREDYYYEEIQKCIQKLEQIKKAKETVSLAEARQNYQAHEFLNGVDGRQSLKQKLESELLQLQFKNTQLEKEMALRSQLAANEEADLNYEILLKDLKIEEQNQVLKELNIN